MVYFLSAAVVYFYSALDSWITGSQETHILLMFLVGAGRLELPTPCAQVGESAFSEVARFQSILSQLDAGSLLKAVELC